MSKKNIILTYAMAIIGFALILFNALNYIFHLGMGNIALFVIGIVFVVIGMGYARKNNEKTQ